MTDQNCVAEAPRECCRTPGNVPLVPDHPDARPERGCVVRICRVCGARHFELHAEPAVFGLIGRGISEARDADAH